MSIEHRIPGEVGKNFIEWRLYKCGEQLRVEATGPDGVMQTVFTVEATGELTRHVLCSTCDVHRLLHVDTYHRIKDAQP
jgi:hypothetical protein